MKKLLLSAAIAAFALSNVNAQEEKVGSFSNGDIFATGSISFGSETQADDKTNTFRFNPSVGFFVSDNVAVGVAIGLQTSKFEDGFSDDFKTNAFTAGAFGQYYFTPENQFSFLVQLSALYTSSKSEQGSNELKGNGFTAGLAPGVNYFISKCLSLQANLGLLNYSTFKFDAPGQESSDNFDIGLNLANINFGITYKFN